MDTENSCQRGQWLEDWVKMVAGLSKQGKKPPHRHRQRYGDYPQGKGVGEVEKSKGGINGDENRLDLGW